MTGFEPLEAQYLEELKQRKSIQHLSTNEFEAFHVLFSTKVMTLVKGVDLTRYQRPPRWAIYPMHESISVESGNIPMLLSDEISIVYQAHSSLSLEQQPKLIFQLPMPE